MEIKEYGNKKHPAVLIVENEKEEPEIQNKMLDHLVKYYRLIVLTDKETEETTDKQADSVQYYLKGHHYYKLYAMCGTSKEWNIVSKLIQKDISSNKLIIEHRENTAGSLFIPMLEEFAAEDRVR